MSDEPNTSLSDELSARVREIDTLKERLRESESEAGKVGALNDAIENEKTQSAKLRVERDALKQERDELQQRVSTLETEARASSEDADQIKALEEQLEAARAETAEAKEHAQAQTDAYNQLSSEHEVLGEQLRKAQGAETAARHFKDFLDFVENVE